MPTPDLVANVAVIGRMQLMPGILPVRLENPAVECLVAHAFPGNRVRPLPYTYLNGSWSQHKIEEDAWVVVLLLFGE